MNNLTSPGAKPWQLRRLWDALNQYQLARDFAAAIESEFPAGYQFDLRLARAILDHRAQLPGGRYTDLTQLETLAGLTPARFRDLVMAFGIPADELFARRMYAQVILENWQLVYDRTTFRDAETFRSTVDCFANFRQWLRGRVGHLARSRTGDIAATAEAEESLDQSCNEVFPSGNIASYALALWFYRFDQDNWFSFDQVRLASESYLDYFTLFNERTELRMFTGFENMDLLAPGITVTGLPVVINYAEQAITIWSASLFD